eukprot:scaffold707_cov240-Pinguiococcus_pyrenoidosus.AAC.21
MPTLVLLRRHGFSRALPPLLRCPLRASQATIHALRPFCLDVRQFRKRAPAWLSARPEENRTRADHRGSEGALEASSGGSLVWDSASAARACLLPGRCSAAPSAAPLTNVREAWRRPRRIA